MKNRERNFTLEKRTIDNLFNCNAELTGSDKQFFISEMDSTLFQNGSTRSDEFAHSGKYSSKIDAGSSYGMAIKFKGLKNGESFAICVWRKTTGKSKGGLIASGSPDYFYNNEIKILETDPNGWEKIFKEFFISSELANQELVIYEYNPESDPVYFDDLEIIRYKSVLTHVFTAHPRENYANPRK